MEVNPTALLKKLQWKGQPRAVVLDPPESFNAETALWPAAGLNLTPGNPDAPGSTASFGTAGPPGLFLAFVTTLSQVEALAARLAGFNDQSLVWLAYPKQSSKRFRCEFNRDTGWASLEAAGWLPVRQVALDEDWSALRFRPRGAIKTLTRRF